MPVPLSRDSEATTRALITWLRHPRRLPGARIEYLETPALSGFSSEILLVDAVAGQTWHAFAIRLAPTRYQVFPEPRFDEQYRVMRVLALAGGIPVPAGALV